MQNLKFIKSGDVYFTYNICALLLFIYRRRSRRQLTSPRPPLLMALPCPRVRRLAFGLPRLSALPYAEQVVLRALRVCAI